MSHPRAACYRPPHGRRRAAPNKSEHPNNSREAAINATHPRRLAWRAAFAAAASLALFAATAPRASAACTPTPQTVSGDLDVTADTTWCADVTVTGNLTIRAGVTVTVENTPALLVHGDATIEPGAHLSADGKGFAAASGTGFGNSSSSYSGAGASHGGRGGQGYNQGANQTWYGSALLPTTAGSGGGSGRGSVPGGAGGGVIALAVGGDLVLNGTISANGGDGGDSTVAGGGGGAGGTIRLTADDLSGSGTLTARGGRGGNRSNSTGTDYGTGGGGAGGRVTVRSLTRAWLPSHADVAGGVAGTNGNPNGNVGRSGGAGTVAVITISSWASPWPNDTRAADRDLLIAGPYRFQTESAPAVSFNTVTIAAGASVVGGATTTIGATTLAVTGGAWDMTLESAGGGCDGECEASAHTVTWNVGAVSMSGGVIDGDRVGSLTFNVTGTFSQSGGSLSARNLDLNGASVAFAWSGAAVCEAQNLTLDAASATIGVGARLGGDGMGSLGATATASASGSGAGNNNGNSGGGASHGGRGGEGYSGVGQGTFYGSARLPTTLGGGGGRSTSAGGTDGGDGGGAVFIALSGALTVDGTLSSNGASSASATEDSAGTGGGGAGGTVRVKATSVGGTGRIEALGGDSGDRTGGGTDRGVGGGGGGGRVVVRAKSASFDFATHASVRGGRAGGAGGGTTAQVTRDGGRGTLAFIELASDAITTTDAVTTEDRVLHIYDGWRFESGDGAVTGLDAIVIHDGAALAAGTSSIAITTGAFTATNATWDLTAQSVGGCDGLCEATATTITVNATTIAISGSTLAGGNVGSWVFVPTTSFSFAGGTVSGVGVTVNGAGASVAFGAAAVVDGATVDVTGASVSIAATAAVKADARSTATSGQPSSNNYGGGGASHGGRGGNGAATNTSTPNGGTAPQYVDSALMPALPGAQGGHGASGNRVGGLGGGVVFLTAAGALTIDGAVSANGGAGTDSDNSNGSGGGGAGGTVRISAASVGGDGTIAATGGRGGARPSTNTSSGAGGGGGGGRVTLRALSWSFPASHVDVSGGAAGTHANAYVNADGGLGTFALIRLDDVAGAPLDDATRAHDKELYLTNGFRFESGDQPISIPSIIMQDGAHVVGGGTNVTVSTTAFTATGGLWENAVESAGGCTGTCDVTQTVTIAASTVDIGAGDFDGQTRGTFVFDLTTSFDMDGGTLRAGTVRFKGPILYRFAGTALVRARNGYVTASDLLVDTGARVGGDGMGDLGATLAAGSSNGSGSGPGYGSTNGGGASHGGWGGNSANNAGQGTIFGSALAPTSLGSGGGRATIGGGTDGGDGGGAFFVAVTGDVTLNGTLSSNGATAASSDTGGTGGGGAGGTLRVKADHFGGTGFIELMGGDGGARTGTGTDSGTGGGGGGGRGVVRARSSDFVFAGHVDVSGGQGGASASTYVGKPGGRGTFAYIAIKDTADTSVDPTTIAGGAAADDLDIHIYDGFRFESADSPVVARSVTIHDGALVVGEKNAAAVTLNLTGALTVTNAIWDTRIKSEGGCNGACASAFEQDVTVNAASVALTGAQLLGDTLGSWAFVPSASFTMTGGALSGVDVRVDTPGGTVAFGAGAAVNGLNVDVTGASVSIAATAAVGADARSTATNGQPSSNSYGGGGASHGGRGGNGAATSTSTPNGGTAPQYVDSALMPALPGAQGGHGASGNRAGGLGGGVVFLTAAGALTIDGAVSANGGAGTDSDNSNGSGGGGAGGTVRISAASVGGDGTIAATGGRAARAPRRTRARAPAAAAAAGASRCARCRGASPRATSTSRGAPPAPTPTRTSTPTAASARSRSSSSPRRAPRSRTPSATTTSTSTSRTASASRAAISRSRSPRSPCRTARTS
ncbi:MAG: hypothetical protein H6745_20125 [Deltaproteobacteria bacterium]|nr:hypothetical protein [Deltaproteobacteria bacterium]